MAIKITQQQWQAQWSFLPSKFDVNVLNFEIALAKDLEEVFKKSFYLKRLNAPGSPAWPARKDNRAHELLVETASLRDSVKGTPFMSGNIHGAMVYAGGKDALRHANRQFPSIHVNGKSTRPFDYSRIHNLGGKRAGATGGAANILQRQYIGHSAYATDRLKANEYIIFKDFPK